MDSHPPVASWSSMHLVAMGAGAPMMGDLKKTNFDKPESEGGAALQFELEANNFDLNARAPCLRFILLLRGDHRCDSNDGGLC